MLSATTDGSGNAWLLGDRTISKVSGSGSLLHSGVSTDGCFKFDTSNKASIANTAQYLLYDRVHDHLWGLGEFSIGVLGADGSQVFCDAFGMNLPLFIIDQPAGPVASGFLFVSSPAVDGSGNLWFTGAGETFGNLNGTLVGTALSELNELSPNGTLMTPYDANAGVFGVDLSDTGVQNLNGALSQGLAIDAYGNIWYLNSAVQNELVKIPGLAVPKTYQ